MNRRDFLTGATMAGLAGLLPRSVQANAMRERAQAFRDSLATRPWLLGWRSAEANRFTADAGDIRIEGEIPADLNGDLYRNGPAGHEVHGQRYEHWFDGDGMIQRFRIREGKVDHLAQIIATPKWQAEQAEGRPLFNTFGTKVPDARRIRSADQLNVANISVLDHGGRLMALWEGGSPSEIDRESLDYKGFVRFSPETTGLPFSAHTRTDPDGTLWSIGYAGYAGKVFLWQIAPDGALKKITAVDIVPTPMLHDFIVTERHLVLFLTPWRYHMDAGDTFLARHVWEPEQGGQALIIDKNDHDSRRTVDLPPFWVYHFANGWEGSDGLIHLDFPRYSDPSATVQGFRDIMAGERLRGSEASYCRATLDPVRGTWREGPVFEGAFAEFPAVDRRLTGQRHSKSFACLVDPAADAAHPFFTTTAAIDVDTGKVDGYVHAPTEIAEEALFVPSTRHSGWVLQTVLDFQAEVTRLKVFQADALSNGPVAVASLPYALPLGLHGLFVEAG